jgi:fibro-slime domain-containing protein
MPSAAGQCFDPCTPWNDMNQACCGEVTQMMFDGNPLFFPVDGIADPADDLRVPAKIPAEYGHDGWPTEDSVFPGAMPHNFYFTTEVAYWFAYDPAVTAVLEFAGDDDVWVFVNGVLAVDLGGPHVPELGTVTIDAASGARFGLSEGGVYEIRVFHAERKVDGSSFKLTLSGFDAQPSDCTPICGDSIVTAGEECDDGVNDGGYEECSPGCVLGESCGDGVVQADEDCDDGNRVDGDGCGSSCRILTVD